MYRYVLNPTQAVSGKSAYTLPVYPICEMYIPVNPPGLLHLLTLKRSIGLKLHLYSSDLTYMAPAYPLITNPPGFPPHIYTTMY